MDIFLICIISYLMGSIPFGLILTKIFLNKDIREIGSGNIGATNALRTGNKSIGYSTLVLDILKFYRKFNFNSNLLEQKHNLPFGNSREDIVVCHPDFYL